MNALLVLVLLVCAALALRRAVAALPAQRRAWLIAACLVFIAGLPALVFWLAPVRSVAVITPGASDVQQRHAARARYAYRIGEAAANATGSLPSAPGIEALRSRFGGLEQITVYGAGRAPRSGEAARVGIEALRAPARVAPGSELVLHGVVTPPGDSAWQVELRGPGDTAEDRVTAFADGRFSLRTRARAAGQFRYSVAVLDADNRAVARRDVHIDVRAPAPLRLLTLWGAPSFETRFLQNWARLGGASVLMRTRIGESVFRRDAVGAQWPDGDRVSDALLDDVDVLVADGRAWSTLNAPERRAIDAALAQRRIGVVIVPPLDDLAGLSTDTLVVEDAEYAVALAGASATLIPAAGYWRRPDASAVLSTQRGQTLARRVETSAGAPVVISSVYGSHRWVMADAAGVHADYWQTLFDAALPPSSLATWQAPHAAALGDTLFVACLEGEDAASIRYRANSAQSVTLPTFATAVSNRCVATVPDTGWFELRAQGTGDDATVAQWFAAEGLRASGSSGTGREVLRLTPGEVPFGPREPRMLLAWLVLLAAAALWRLEREVWHQRAGHRVVNEQTEVPDDRAAA